MNTGAVLSEAIPSAGVTTATRFDIDGRTLLAVGRVATLQFFEVCCDSLRFLSGHTFSERITGIFHRVRSGVSSIEFVVGFESHKALLCQLVGLIIVTNLMFDFAIPGEENLATSSPLYALYGPDILVSVCGFNLDHLGLANLNTGNTVLVHMGSDPVVDLKALPCETGVGIVLGILTSSVRLAENWIKNPRAATLSLYTVDHKIAEADGGEEAFSISLFRRITDLPSDSYAIATFPPPFYYCMIIATKKFIFIKPDDRTQWPVRFCFSCLPEEQAYSKTRIKQVIRACDQYLGSELGVSDCPLDQWDLLLTQNSLISLYSDSLTHDRVSFQELQAEPIPLCPELVPGHPLHGCDVYPYYGYDSTSDKAEKVTLTQVNNVLGGFPALDLQLEIELCASAHIDSVLAAKGVSRRDITPGEFFNMSAFGQHPSNLLYVGPRADVFNYTIIPPLSGVQACLLNYERSGSCRILAIDQYGLSFILSMSFDGFAIKARSIKMIPVILGDRCAAATTGSPAMLTPPTVLVPLPPLSTIPIGLEAQMAEFSPEPQVLYSSVFVGSVVEDSTIYGLVQTTAMPRPDYYHDFRVPRPKEEIRNQKALLSDILIQRSHHEQVSSPEDLDPLSLIFPTHIRPFEGGILSQIEHNTLAAQRFGDIEHTVVFPYALLPSFALVVDAAAKAMQTPKHSEPKRQRRQKKAPDARPTLYTLHESGAISILNTHVSLSRAGVRLISGSLKMEKIERVFLLRHPNSPDEATYTVIVTSDSVTEMATYRQAKEHGSSGHKLEKEITERIINNEPTLLAFAISPTIFVQVCPTRIQLFTASKSITKLSAELTNSNEDIIHAVSDGISLLVLGTTSAAHYFVLTIADDLDSFEFKYLRLPTLYGPLNSTCLFTNELIRERTLGFLGGYYPESIKIQLADDATARDLFDDFLSKLNIEGTLAWSLHISESGHVTCFLIGTDADHSLIAVPLWTWVPHLFELERSGASGQLKSLLERAFLAGVCPILSSEFLSANKDVFNSDPYRDAFKMISSAPKLAQTPSLAHLDAVSIVPQVGGTSSMPVLHLFVAFGGGQTTIYKIDLDPITASTLCVTPFSFRDGNVGSRVPLTAKTDVWAVARGTRRPLRIAAPFSQVVVQDSHYPENSAVMIFVGYAMRSPTPTATSYFCLPNLLGTYSITPVGRPYSAAVSSTLYAVPVIAPIRQFLPLRLVYHVDAAIEPVMALLDTGVGVPSAGVSSENDAHNVGSHLYMLLEAFCFGSIRNTYFGTHLIHENSPEYAELAGVSLPALSPYPTAYPNILLHRRLADPTTLRSMQYLWSYGSLQSAPIRTILHLPPGLRGKKLCYHTTTESFGVIVYTERYEIRPPRSIAMDEVAGIRIKDTLKEERIEDFDPYGDQRPSDKVLRMLEVCKSKLPPNPATYDTFLRNRFESFVLIRHSEACPNDYRIYDFFSFDFKRHESNNCLVSDILLSYFPERFTSRHMHNSGISRDNFGRINRRNYHNSKADAREKQLDAMEMTEQRREILLLGSGYLLGPDEQCYGSFKLFAIEEADDKDDKKENIWNFGLWSGRWAVRLVIQDEFQNVVTAVRTIPKNKVLLISESKRTCMYYLEYCQRLICCSIYEANGYVAEITRLNDFFLMSDLALCNKLWIFRQKGNRQTMICRASPNLKIYTSSFLVSMSTLEFVVLSVTMNRVVCVLTYRYDAKKSELLASRLCLQSSTRIPGVCVRQIQFLAWGPYDTMRNLMKNTWADTTPIGSATGNKIEISLGTNVTTGTNNALICSEGSVYVAVPLPLALQKVISQVSLVKATESGPHYLVHNKIDYDRMLVYDSVLLPMLQHIEGFDTVCQCDGLTDESFWRIVWSLTQAALCF
ncbi:CPSF A subunit-containing protein [Giardia muris]|uniref:CPSF A subunit-containing protein n=1 Tax=Giardia muris TaxID=5742 RepID=A0A4Z1T2M0_GIAMU|nr:CPSF A subunit-containing protein [Giardia muris]|eukprot:TNJ28193.1 CPSF A subunit-containing protein [Giardia muris]